MEIVNQAKIQSWLDLSDSELRAEVARLAYQPGLYHGKVARHPEYGVVRIISSFPDVGASVRVCFPNNTHPDGAEVAHADVEDLTFVKPEVTKAPKVETKTPSGEESPEILFTLEDYENALEGTICAESYAPVFFKGAFGNWWSVTESEPLSANNLRGVHRTVYRDGWE